MSELIGSTPTEPSPVLFRPWRELTILALMAMDLCWLTIWYVTFSRIGGNPATPALVAVTLAVQLVISHYLARVMNTYRLATRVRRMVFAAGLVISVWATLQLLLYPSEFLSPVVLFRRILPRFAEPNLIPPEFWVMLMVLLVWSRGVSLARRAPGVDRALTSFQVGILIFCVYAYFYTNPFFREHLPLRTVLWAFYWFLFLGLIAMSAARIYETGRGRGGKQARVSFAWLAGIGLAALLIASLGILPAVVLPPDAPEYIARYLLTALVFIIAVIFIVASPVILVLLLVLPALQKLWAQIFSAVDLSGFGDALRPLNLQDAFDRLGIRIAAAKPAALWGVLILAAIAVLAGLTWRMWAERSADQEEGETLVKASDLLKAVQAALLRRMQQARGRFRLRGAERMVAAARVRWIYARLMGLCIRLDHPRPVAVTPLEFLPDLNTLFPGLDNELGQITNAYVRVRYGDAPETGEQVDQLQAAWDQILRSARRQMSLRKVKPR